MKFVILRSNTDSNIFEQGVTIKCCNWAVIIWSLVLPQHGTIVPLVFDKRNNDYVSIKYLGNVPWDKKSGEKHG